MLRSECGNTADDADVPGLTRTNWDTHKIRSSRKMPPTSRAQVRKPAFGFRLERNAKIIELSAGNNKLSLDAYLPMISAAIAQNLAPNAIK